MIYLLPHRFFAKPQPQFTWASLSFYWRGKLVSTMNYEPGGFHPHPLLGEALSPPLAEKVASEER